MKMTTEMLKLNKLLGEKEQDIIHDKNVQYVRDRKEQNPCLFFFFFIWLFVHWKNIKCDYHLLKKLGTTPNPCNPLAFCITET